MANKAKSPSVLMDRPVLGAGTGGASGGSLADATYYYKATALDINGNESFVSDQVTSTAVSGGGGSGSVAIAAATELPGVPQTGAAYRVYVGTATGVQTGYFTVTAAEWIAGFTDTGATTFARTTGTPPTTNAGKAFRGMLDDSSINGISTATNAGLQTLINAVPVHETFKNYQRQFSAMIQRMFDIKVIIDTPGVVSGGNLTTATSGGTLLDSTTYYFKIVAVDPDGGLSTPSAEISKATGSGGAGNVHTITLKNLTQVVGAASYRIYVATTTETFTLGYFAVTKSNMEGSTGGTYTGQALTAGTIPTQLTATGKVAVLSDDDVAAAKAAAAGAEFTTLRTAVREHANTAADVPADQDFGEQAI